MNVEVKNKDKLSAAFKINKSFKDITKNQTPEEMNEKTLKKIIILIVILPFLSVMKCIIFSIQLCIQSHKIIFERNTSKKTKTIF